MSAWKSTLLLPTLFLSSQSSCGRPAGRRERISAVDLIGFWTLDRRFGDDLYVAVETLFSQDGRFETRTFLESNGEIERHHAFGTWASKADAFVTMPSPTAFRSLGDVTEGCGDSSSDVLAVENRLGKRTLVLDLGEELGSYVSPIKAFTLPDLFPGGFADRAAIMGSAASVSAWG